MATRPSALADDSLECGSSGSDGSDEWGAAELVIPDNLNQSNSQPSKPIDPLNDDDYWKIQPDDDTPKRDPTNQIQKSQDNSSGEPMIIVDMALMDPNIHSRFDPNAVNDSEGASKLRKTIEQDYAKYAKHSSHLVADGTIIPCGSSVWRPALVKLRKDRPGHYFCPIFGPKK